ncbi:MAG: serine protein kinase RIO [archaeon]
MAKKKSKGNGSAKSQHSASDEEKLSKVYGKIFDRHSIGALHRLSVKRYFSQLESPVNEGKEATVFRARDHAGNYRAVKIYKINTSSFSHMSKYVTGDERFRGIPKDRKEMVFAWTRKEFANLERADSVGVRVPKPITFMDNVLVMEFIGDKNGNAFPALKECRPDEKEVRELRNKMIESVARLYYLGEMVHADFSEYNLLYNGKELVVIDMGQAVLKSHPKANEFLERDLRNIASYSTRNGVKTGYEEARTLAKEWESRLKKGSSRLKSRKKF